MTFWIKINESHKRRHLLSSNKSMTEMKVCCAHSLHSLLNSWTLASTFSPPFQRTVSPFFSMGNHFYSITVFPILNVIRDTIPSRKRVMALCVTANRQLWDGPPVHIAPISKHGFCKPFLINLTNVDNGASLHYYSKCCFRAVRSNCLDQSLVDWLALRLLDRQTVASQHQRTLNRSAGILNRESCLF